MRTDARNDSAADNGKSVIPKNVGSRRKNKKKLGRYHEVEMLTEDKHKKVA